MTQKSVAELLDEITGRPAPIVATAATVFKTSFMLDELYDMNYEKLPCLFGDIIPARGLWTLVGSSDTGKSMLLRQLVIECANGNPFLGWQNNGVYKRCVFIATEDDAASTSYLVRRQLQSKQDAGPVCFHFNSADIPQYLETELARQPADLVVIDAWSDVFGQDLKDSALIRKTLNIYNTIAGKYCCSICFLHHTGKRTEKLEPSKNNILSGQGYEAKMRLVIEMRADATDPNLRHLCIVKGNYLGGEYKNASFVLHFNPANFTFTNTGRRTDFTLLAAPITPQQDRKASTPFADVDAGIHRALVDIAFGKKQLKYIDAYEALGRVYTNETGETFARDKSRLLLTWLTDNNFITKNRVGGQLMYTAIPG